MGKITRIATVHTADDGGTSTNPKSFSKTIPADCTLIVLLSVVNRSGTSQNISGVTVNGVACTSIVEFPSTGTTIPRVAAWYLVNPATGAQTIEYTYGGSSSNKGWIVLYFKDQHATTPVNAATPTTGSGSSTSPAVGPIASNADGTVYSVVGWNDDGNTIDGSPIGAVSSSSSGTNSRELAVYEDTGSGSVSLAQTLSGSTPWRAIQFVLDGAVSAATLTATVAAFSVGGIAASLNAHVVMAATPAAFGLTGAAVAFTATRQKAALIATTHTQNDNGTSTTPTSFSKTIPADATLAVLLSGVNRSGTNQNITGITIGGVATTKVDAQPSTGTGRPRVEGWYLQTPPTGVQSFVVTYTGSSAERAWAVIYFKSINAAAPINAVGSAKNSANSASPSPGPIVSNEHGTVVIAYGWNNDGTTIDGMPVAAVSSNASGVNSRELAVFIDTANASVTPAQTLSATQEWSALAFVVDGGTPATNTTMGASPASFAVSGQPATLAATILTALPSLTTPTYAAPLRRLFLRSSAIAANTATDITPSAGFSTVAPARSRADVLAMLVRGEFIITDVTPQTSAPSLPAPGDSANLFTAFEEVNAYVMHCVGQSIALDGVAANLAKDSVLTADEATFALVGRAALLLGGRAVHPVVASITLTGRSALLVFTPTNTLVASPVSFDLDATDVAVVATKALPSISGTFVLTAATATIIYTRRLQGDVRAYTSTGRAITLTYSGTYRGQIRFVTARGPATTYYYNVGPALRLTPVEPSS